MLENEVEQCILGFKNTT